MIIRQIAKNKKKALMEQIKTELEINDSRESQSDERIDRLSNDAEYIESKDFTTQEKESTEKFDEKNTKSGDIPEFFLDKEKESEENKE